MYPVRGRGLIRDLFRTRLVRNRAEGVLRWAAYLSVKGASGYASQFGQDRFVHERFFRDKRHGTFVDIGALDGVFASNSLFFERELGWTGLCVEPIPEQFARLVENRSCICVNCCIADFDGETEFLQLSGKDEVLSGIVEKYDPRHALRVQRSLAREATTGRLIRVKCHRLADLLEQHGLAQIDYLSVDTEGGELEILKTIDFRRIDVRVISVENNFCETALGEFLASEGFARVAVIGTDEIYCQAG